MATKASRKNNCKVLQRPPQQIIENAADFKAAYANVMFTAVTPHDFTLTFGRVTGPNKCLAAVSATMPLSIMKDVVELLGRELMKAQLARTAEQKP